MVKVHRNFEESDSQQKRMYTSDSNKVFLGVLGGLAEYFNVDATLLRLVFILFLVFTGFFPGVLLYFLAAVIMPKR